MKTASGVGPRNSRQRRPYRGGVRITQRGPPRQAATGGIRTALHGVQRTQHGTCNAEGDDGPVLPSYLQGSSHSSEVSWAGAGRVAGAGREGKAAAGKWQHGRRALGVWCPAKREDSGCAPWSCCRPRTPCCESAPALRMLGARILRSLRACCPTPIHARSTHTYTPGHVWPLSSQVKEGSKHSSVALSLESDFSHAEA
jgi:hypothetical protein